MNSAVDYPALLLGTAIAVAVTASLGFAERGENLKRAWIVAAALAAVLLAAGLAEVLGETPRETHWAGVILGAILPVTGAVGAIRASRRVRPWLRWIIVFLVTLVLLLGGLLLGATVVPRFIAA